MCLVKCDDCNNLEEKRPTDEEVLNEGAEYFGCYADSESFENDHTVLDVNLGFKKGIICEKFKVRVK